MVYTLRQRKDEMLKFKVGASANIQWVRSVELPFLWDKFSQGLSYQQIRLKSNRWYDCTLLC